MVASVKMGFSSKNCNPPVEDINGKFQGKGRVKVVRIPGGHQILRKFSVVL